MLGSAFASGNALIRDHLSELLNDDIAPNQKDLCRKFEARFFTAAPSRVEPISWSVDLLGLLFRRPSARVDVQRKWRLHGAVQHRFQSAGHLLDQ
ncbi:MAG: hypothetical protein K8J08_22835 [Thermoanaerobaculia bacterium]|nr:hypothetical protein [Thermoanaerobaculia bacterium]